MQDLNQVKLLSKVIGKEKEKHLYELANINRSIATKLNLVNKMAGYLQEYHDQSNLTVSKSSPSLTHNLASFTKKIDLVIAQTNTEIEKLQHSKHELIKKIEDYDQKLELMALFEDQLRKKMLLAASKNEQNSDDDLVSTHDSRGKV